MMCVAGGLVRMTLTVAVQRQVVEPVIGRAGRVLRSCASVVNASTRSGVSAAWPARSGRRD